MAKSNLQLLQEALAKGDLEKAKELTEKMAKKVKKSDNIDQESSNRVIHNDESEYIASSKGGRDILGRKFIKDGQEHTIAKFQSMKDVAFVNNFKPDQYANDLPARHDKCDQKLRKRKQSVPRRNKVEKVRFECSVCHKEFLVYPSELPQKVEGNDGELSYRCNNRGCVTRG